jgi:hypothetical protein
LTALLNSDDPAIVTTTKAASRHRRRTSRTSATTTVTICHTRDDPESLNVRITAPVVDVRVGHLAIPILLPHNDFDVGAA